VCGRRAYQFTRAYLSPIVARAQASNKCVTVGDKRFAGEHFECTRLARTIHAEQTETFASRNSET
jgi:hypothetical protein